MKKNLSATREISIRSARQGCGRCGGYMDRDTCIDLSNSGYSSVWVFRCIQCGDVIDEVILHNRAAFNAQAEPALRDAA
jgi:hypothetical protein